MIPQIYNLLETKTMMIERNKISYLSRVHAVTKRKKKKKKKKGQLWNVKKAKTKHSNSSFKYRPNQ